MFGELLVELMNARGGRRSILVLAAARSTDFFRGNPKALAWLDRTLGTILVSPDLGCHFQTGEGLSAGANGSKTTDIGL
jgi:hypothetical protein